MRSELDRLDLQVAEMGNGLAAVTHNDKLDLRDDEPISAAVFPHVAVQVREAAQVLDFPVVAFHAHACVPSIKRLDQPDDAAEASPVDQLRGVVCVV